jgi:hypothetical protein
VSFEKNCTGPFEEFERIDVRPPATTVEDFPEKPSCPGHRFLGWNTERNGSGEAFTAQTPIRFSNILLIVHAQWEPAPSMEVRSNTLRFSPMVDGSYNERSATLSVVVFGLRDKAEADSVELELEDKPAWLSQQIEGHNFSESEGSKTFEVHVRYEGSTFEELPSTLRLSFLNNEYDSEAPLIHVSILDGKTKERAIHVTQANIQAFNNYANGPEGRAKHYRLVEDVVLEAPAPQTSNWTAIGNLNNASPPFSFPEAFTGSFDGEGHTLRGLVIYEPEHNAQGLFGLISGEGAEIKNIGLIGVSVNGGDSVGGLVGESRQGSTVRNSYVTGKVEGNERVGGLVGYNSGTAQNSNLVRSSYATGSVSGSRTVGGLVGYNSGTVQNSYATGSVRAEGGQGTTAGQYAGGLVGMNISAPDLNTIVENSMALNSSVIANNMGMGIGVTAGRVVGVNANFATLSGNRAFDGMQNRAGDTTWDRQGLGNYDGESISADELRRGELPELFKEEPWKHEPGRLPGLFGKTVEMPEHMN